MPLAIVLLVFAFLLLGAAVGADNFRDRNGNSTLEAHTFIARVCLVIAAICLALAAITA